MRIAPAVIAVVLLGSLLGCAAENAAGSPASSGSVVVAVSTVPDTSSRTAATVAVTATGTADGETVDIGGLGTGPPIPEERLAPWIDRLTVLPGYVDGGLFERGTVVRAYWYPEIPRKALAVGIEAEEAGVDLQNVLMERSEPELMHLACDLIEVLAAEDIQVTSCGPILELNGVRIGGPELSEPGAIQDRARAVAEEHLDGVPLVIGEYHG